MPQQNREPLIRAAVLGGIGEIAATLEIPLLPTLARAGLDPAWLNDPECKVPVARVSQLLEDIARRSGCLDVGLRLSQSVHLQRLGLIGLLAHGRATVGEAFHAVAGFSQLHNEALHVWIEAAGPQSLLREEYLTHAPIPTRQMIELSAGVIVRNVRMLIDDDWAPLRVSFRHAGTSTDTHRRVFSCPVRFNADIDGMHIQSQDFQRPNRLRAADPGDYLAQARALAGSDRVAAAPRLCAQLILGLLAGGDCSASRVALLLGCDRRTLHRHLGASGLSFSTLLNSVRRDLAARHVRLGSRRLADIAQLLGFRSQSDFSHWFHREFDTAPSRWRQREGHQC